MHITRALSTPVLKKAIDRYYKELDEYKGRADYELAVRTAFLNLLAETAHQPVERPKTLSMVPTY